MTPSASLKALQDRLGYRFRDPALLLAALTHGSHGAGSNERLEFLGDRVLGLAIAEALLEADPDAPEGRLSPRLNLLVKGETCAAVGRELALGDAMRLGRSEKLAGGRRRDALLADAIEAVIGATHLDGGYGAARDLVRRLWAPRIAEAPQDATDSKSALQFWAQARGLPPPLYEIVARDGPDHALRFTVEARLATGETARAEGRSRRAAEQEAAATLLGRVG